MLKLKKIITNPIIIVVVFVLGFAVGKINDWGVFKFNPTINFNLFDVISLTITVAVALYIAAILDTEKQKKQVGVEIWIRRFEHIESILNSLSDRINGNNIDYNIVVNTFHHFRSKLSKLNESLNKHGRFPNKDKDFDLLLNRVSKLKNLLTNTPIDKKDTSKITLSGGIVIYSDSRKKEIHNLILQIDNSIFLLKLRVASS